MNAKNEIRDIKADRHAAYLSGEPLRNFAKYTARSMRACKRICRRYDRHQARLDIQDVIAGAFEPETYGSMIVAMLNEREDAILAEMIREGSL